MERNETSETRKRRKVKSFAPRGKTGDPKKRSGGVG